MKKSVIIVTLLLSIYSSIAAIWFDKKLYNFCKKKDFLERIKEVVEKRGGNVNYQSYEWHTPLMKAASRGDESLVKYLLDKKANACFANRNGQTALHKAAKNGNLSTVKLLVKAHKLAVNKCDRGGNTPLHIAAEQNHEKVVKYLVRKGASVYAKNKKGKMPENLPCKSKIAAFLKKKREQPVSKKSK